MATSVRLMRRYVWLVDTIRRAGHISLDEINDRWLRNDALNPDHEPEIPERTFHRHREAIIDLFDIDIACDRATNTYYIADTSRLDQPSFTSWLFNGLALDNQLMCNASVKSKIIFEETPAGMEYLSMIVEAISTDKMLEINYQSYNNPGKPTVWEIAPCGLKQYRRRWYLIGRKAGEDCSLTFALDRIVSLIITDNTFESCSSDDLNEKFSEVVGVYLDTELDVEDVVVRVFGKQRNYFEGTPLHHSQTKVVASAEYSDYSFRLRPEYEFQHEILRLGPDAEILSPQWLREELQWLANETSARYQARPSK